MSVKRGLGKGLDALLADNSVDSDNEAVTLRISEIEPNKNQPRKDFDDDALSELAESIKQHGVIQPLLVRPIMGGGYQLVAGERRWRASRLAGLSEVPVVIRQMDDSQVMVIALIENLQREELNSIEEAEGYRQLSENFGLTQDEIATQVGKSRPAVANAMRLLGLPLSVTQKIRDGSLSAGHARAILTLEDEKQMFDLTENAIKTGMSVREIEKAAKAIIEGNQNKGQKAVRAKRNPMIDEIERGLTEELGRKITIFESKNKGHIEIEFYNLDDLRNISNTIIKE